MHHRTAVAIALVVILVVSSLALASGAVRASPTRSAPAAPHPAATDTIAAVAYYGCGSTFTVGYACGGIYFSAYDPSDTTAVVAIHDLNATRDGLNPTQVQSWNVSFASGPFNDSLTWNIHYELPLTLLLGGWWNITITGTTAGFASQSFYVHTYTVSMSPSEPVVLAQHMTRVLYFVDQTVNGAPTQNISSLTMTATYLTNTAVWAVLPGSPMNVGTAAWGLFNVSIPTDASTFGSIQFTLFANLSAGTTPNSEVGFLDLPVGYVGNPQLSLGTCPTGCNSNSFTDGTPVYVNVQAYIFGSTAVGSANGLTATFEFLSGVTAVTPTGSYPKTVTTNATGGAEIVFIATASATMFSTTTTNSVKVTLTDPRDAGASYGPTTATFTLSNQTPGTARLQVLLDSAQYFGGDTVTATWQLGGLNASITQGWTVSAWWAWADTTSTFIASGMIGSSNSQGTFSFVAPMNYSGRISVDVEAHNVSSSLDATRIATVTAPAIFLNTGSLYYAPGDTVTVSVTTSGSIFQNAQLYRTIVDSSGNVLQSGAFTGGQLSFPIPQIGAPTSVRVDVAAQDPVLGIVGQSSLTVYEGSGITVMAGVSTISNYADGSFQPGQSIQIHYAIAAVGVAVLPKVFTVEVYQYGLQLSSQSGAAIVSTSSASGDVPFTIPSGTPAGVQVFEVFVVASGCYTGCYAATVFSVSVQPNPSVLGYELGAGSGLTVGWFILFVLILLVAILFFWMFRQRGRPMMMKPVTMSGTAPSSTSGGTTTSPGTGGTDAWKESQGGSSNPPLPNPPKSS